MAFDFAGVKTKVVGPLEAVEAVTVYSPLGMGPTNAVDSSAGLFKPRPLPE